MKPACVAAIVLLSLIACHQSTDATNTASNATTGTPPQTAAASDTGINVSVNFTGLVAHVLGPYQKAVIVNAPGHLHEIKITGASPAAGAVVNQLNGECLPDACTFTLNYMALQLLNGKGEVPTGNLKASDSSFAALVPDLGTLNASAYVDANLTAEAKGEIKDGSMVSWGTFDLRGGNAHSDPMDCRGKIMSGSGDFRQFGKATTVKYTLSSASILRVTDAKKHTYDIPLQGPAVSIDVTNFMPGSHQSDFDQYAKLSTVPVTLPQIVMETSEACKKATIGEQNGVPGCEDTRVALGTMR